MWKTSGGALRLGGVVQGYIYAVAHRLSYDDGVSAVLECKVSLIRDSGA